MVRILCIGDSHIPYRVKNLPDQIYSKINSLTEQKLFDFTFFTGDLIKSSQLLDYLNLKTRKDLFIVRGNMDHYYGNRDSPFYRNLELFFDDKKKLSIGLTHGSEIEPRGDYSQLEHLAISKKNHIIIAGHTHKEEIFLTNQGILLLNPGSVTGVWSFIASGIPSFIELIINRRNLEIKVILYQLNKEMDDFLLTTYIFFLESNLINKKE